MKISPGLNRRIALRIRRRISCPDYGYPDSEACYLNFKHYCTGKL